MIPLVGRLHHVTSGESFALEDVTLLGRSRESAVPIPDPRVSRRHAMIRRQDDGFWYFDLGSVNGSLINGRRVTTSQLLATGDLIHISDHCFRFEGASNPNAIHGDTMMAHQTIVDVLFRSVILLVSDIRGFTAISEKLAPEQLAPIIGSWYSRTESILHRHGATIDKFIGDSVMAYWLDTSPASRMAALKAAREMAIACDQVQQEHLAALGPFDLQFDSGTAVHMGPAACGAFSPREFTLLGDAVNLAFRLESLTRTLNRRVLLSADLLIDWEEGVTYCHNLGTHPVKGRDQLVNVYSLEHDFGRSPAENT